MKSIKRVERKKERKKEDDDYEDEDNRETGSYDIEDDK